MTDDYLRELNKPTVRLKLPVWKTVGRAYGSVFRNLFEVIRVSWFVGLLLAVSMALLSSIIVSMLQDQVGEDIRDIQSFAFSPAYIAISLALYVLMPILVIGLTKVFLDDPRQKPWFYFSIGAAELRYFAAIITIYLILLGAMGLFMASSVLPALVFGADNAFVPAMSTMLAIVGLVIYFIAAFTVMAVSTLLPGINLKEKRIGLVRAFRRARGNMLRIIGSVMVLYLSFFILFMLASVGIGLAASSGLVQWIPSGSMGNRGTQLDAFGFGIVFGTMTLLYLLPFLILITSLSSQIYLALTPKPKPKVEAQPGDQQAPDGEAVKKEETPVGAEPAPAS